jgi:hypothetical protein
VADNNALWEDTIDTHKEIFTGISAPQCRGKGVTVDIFEQFFD